MSRTCQKFLVPVDLSLHSQEALQCAAALAARMEATLLVLHIIGHGSEMLRRGPARGISSARRRNLRTWRSAARAMAVPDTFPI